MIDRRSFLRGAVLGAGISALPRRVLAASAHPLSRANPVVDHQLLFVFLRGGNCGVNSVVPVLDPTYLVARPTLGLPTASCIALPGVNYIRLNPNLARLVGVDLAGRLAILHQVGDPTATRSHFTAMDMFETASSSPVTQAALAGKHGFVPKMMTAVGAPPLTNNLPAALSVSQLMQKMFRAGSSTQLSAHVRSLQASQLHLPLPMNETGFPSALVQSALDHYAAPKTNVDQQLGANLTFGVLANGGLEGLNFDHATQFAATQRFPNTAADLAALMAALPPSETAVLPTYDPKGEALMAAAEQAVFGLTRVPGLRVAGIEFGGFDTHANQDVEQPNLLRYLGWAIRDLDDEIQAAGLGSRITVIVVSEFGRTARENSSHGTDHGVGGLSFAMGGRVVSGTFNCHDANPGAREFGQPWRQLLDPTVLPGSPFYDACDVKTGLRDILAEVSHKLLGVPLAGLGAIVEGYPASSASFLDFLT